MMFGYFTPDFLKLNKPEKKDYKGVYCSLCRALYKDYGSAGERSLSYDMTFLVMLLRSLYTPRDVHEYRASCIVRPFKKRVYTSDDIISYCSSMNVLLSYYKYLDDWNDDKNARALKNSRTLEMYLCAIKEKYTRQFESTARLLAQLSGIEKRNEMNVDLCMNCFAGITGEIFVFQKDEFETPLRALGESLGRFIYLLDACNDLKSDLKKKRYNPLASDVDTDWTSALKMTLGEGAEVFESLAFKGTRYLHILRNIIYSGLWLKYRMRSAKRRLRKSAPPVPDGAR